MYVLIAMEWATNQQNSRWPTQLAALRVSSGWDTVDTFSALVRPKDSSFCLWESASFSGWSSADFQNAPVLEQVLREFQMWLRPDDIVCWWLRRFKRLFYKLLQKTGTRLNAASSIVLRPYLFCHLLGQPRAVGSPRVLCQARDIPVSWPAHCAQSDVAALQALLKGVGFPQHRLLSPLEPWAREEAAQKGTSAFPLLYDPETNLIHQANCPLLPEQQDLPAYSTFHAVLRNGYSPCSICMGRYYRMLQAQNQTSISRTNYLFFYSDNSKVFHRWDCPHALRIRALRGSSSYYTCSQSRRPCKFCRPRPDIAYPGTSGVPARLMPPKEEKAALARFYQAKKERDAILQNGSLTPEQRSAALTLSHPGLAFWASQGYQTFHLKTCPKLRGLIHLRGFARYQEAVQAGYVPCRCCKPSSKQDITVSIPITNQVRPGENRDTLVGLCTEHQLPFQYGDNSFTLQTPAGKWRIDLSLWPVRVKHINLVVRPNCHTYHLQPRLFLSLQDTFDYILHHDKALLRTGRRPRIRR